MKNLIVFGLTLLIVQLSSAKTSDYQDILKLQATLKIGLGVSYSKLEEHSDTGNYFLLSQTNPRFEVRYFSPLNNQIRQLFQFYYTSELFKPENNQFYIRNTSPRSRVQIGWQPQKMSQGGGYALGANLRLKYGTLISEIPDPFNVYGNIDDLYAGEIGASFVWFGQTVAKLPMSLDFDIAYSGVLSQTANFKYKSGLVYRFGIDFDFNKRSLFNNWNLRFFYEYEEFKTEVSPFVDKELGFSLSRSFQF